MSVSGRWEGKMLDVSGTESRVVLDLEDSGRGVSGDFSVYAGSARDGCGCGGSPKLVHLAAVKGTHSEARGRVKLTYVLQTSKAGAEVRFAAEIREADPHARRALVGSYEVADKAAQIGMEGGSCVLWQYAGKGGN